MFLTKDSKSPYYQLVYFVEGKRTKISTKTTDREEAEKFLKAFIPEPTKPAAQGIKSKISLIEFSEEYKTYVGNTYSKHYLSQAVVPSFNKLLKLIPNLPLDCISTKIIDQFISAIQANSNFAASLYYRTLKAAFTKAVVWNYIQENPFNKIKPPKTIQSYPAFVTFDELQIIINNTEKDFLKPLFYTAFFTGMRLGELVNMKWNWIDFQNNFITIKCDVSFTTKNRRERYIPINPTLKNILIGIQPKINNIKNDAFVFTNRIGIKLNEGFVSKVFKRAVRLSKLNNKIHFHSLRHSFCSNLVQKGVSLYVVKDLAGHQNIKTTQIYSHLQSQNLKDAVNLL
jgi:site-specific recombinase XerD